MAEPHPLDKAWLVAHPLPAIASEGDKEERGVVLVAGGSPQTPGAVLLAGEAALRAGAGKLRIATVVETAGLVAVALPEARVLDCLSHPELVPLEQIAAGCAAVLIGPGLLDERLAEQIVGKVLTSGAPALVLTCTLSPATVWREKSDRLAIWLESLAPRSPLCSGSWNRGKAKAFTILSGSQARFKRDVDPTRPAEQPRPRPAGAGKP